LLTSKPKILHIAPQNFAGMPYDFVKMHIEAGFESRLITLYQNTLNFPEDITLNFKLPKNPAARMWRNSKAESKPDPGLKYYKPKNIFERSYFDLRDKLNKKKINDAIEKYSLYDYDIYHFDGGMDLSRDCQFAKELKRRGKKIVCCYFGSDLRTRGIFEELDKLSDLNLTVEFDHLGLYEGIKYIFFPFDEREYDVTNKENKKVKIVHSPTNRKFKGTDKILKVIDELKNESEFEFILLENMEREKILKIKNECDIAIDQVGGELGGSGYGKNSLETLSMGIPTVTEFSNEYLKFLDPDFVSTTDTPVSNTIGGFVHSTIDTLLQVLINLIRDKKLRKDLSVKGRKWVEAHHSYKAVNEMLLKYYKEFNIL
jgi:glycosyltransferase involved in cell wall biosynthesis